MAPVSEADIAVVFVDESGLCAFPRALDAHEHDVFFLGHSVKTGGSIEFVLFGKRKYDSEGKNRDSDK